MQEPRCHEGVSLSAENIAAAFWSTTKHGEATISFYAAYNWKDCLMTV